jgi:hypothetical protein
VQEGILEEQREADGHERAEIAVGLLRVVSNFGPISDDRLWCRNAL